MPFDGAMAEEEARADLGVGEAVAREPCDLLLLRRERLALVDGARTRLLACRDELDAGAFCERLHADHRQEVVRRAQLDARLGAATLGPQPLAVEEMRACELR